MRRVGTGSIVVGTYASVARLSYSNWFGLKLDCSLSNLSSLWNKIEIKANISICPIVYVWVCISVSVCVLIAKLLHDSCQIELSLGWALKTYSYLMCLVGRRARPVRHYLKHTNLMQQLQRIECGCQKRPWHRAVVWSRAAGVWP